ncbi:Potassium voltage-gated channel subfamily KQT member 5 isoform 1 [Schistosoma japonicum]|uniref:Potassium voltage-gated channel subfamily KQT member 5 isoform 1 n=2 Tax=Schistosoma japonicum TaxID=6182 RepID=A0A4Z2CZK5_SCHJA|nr:Potassium voltage-gated channel subfamily KQT member 5 isoform 1 [Schistosoma japonicum]
MNTRFSSPVFMDTCNHYTRKNQKRLKNIFEIKVDEPINVEMKHQPVYNIEPSECSSTVIEGLLHYPYNKPLDTINTNVGHNTNLCDPDLEICSQSKYTDVYDNSGNSNNKTNSDYKKLQYSTSAEFKHYLTTPSQECTQRRTSLHGKTITIRISRNETRYRKLQAKIYNFLERPKTWPSVVYHVFVFASVFGCLVLSVLSTINEYAESAGRVLLYMELVILFWFFAEYCLRLWSAGCRSRYQTWRGRLHFARRPFCIVDVIVIVASVVVLAVDSDRNMFAASALRGLRFFQILRMIRMDRRGGSFKLLASVVWAHRQELFTTVYIGFLGLLFSSFLIFLVEKKENEKIRTYADALWWGVITLCTVGYGDTVPKTWMGKIIAAFCALAGISFFALPAGILGSGFALKVQQHQRQKHLIRRRVPAATLIQCLWRCYAADPHSSSVATWKIHMRPIRKPVGLTNSYSMIERSGFSRFSRFSTLKRRSEKTPTNINSHVINTSTDDANDETIKSAPPKNEDIDVMYAFMNDEDNTNLQHIKDPIKPQDSDEKLEKASNELLPIFTKVQMTNNNRLNVTDPLSTSQCEYISKSKSGINSTQQQTGNNQQIFPQDSFLCSSRGSEVIMHPLTEKEKIAVRVIRKLRFFVARRKFREALRPYDVKDVIEQYSAGHVDMLARVKILQARLDQILGRPGSKSDDVYDSHQCLASRIVKIEHKIDSVEMKLDRLINIFKADCLSKHRNQLEYTEVNGKRLLQNNENCIQHSDCPVKLKVQTENSALISTARPHSQLTDDRVYVIHRGPYSRCFKQRLPASERNSLAINHPLLLTSDRWQSTDDETCFVNTNSNKESEYTTLYHSNTNDCTHTTHSKSQSTYHTNEPPSTNRRSLPLQSTSSSNILTNRHAMSTYLESCLKNDDNTEIQSCKTSKTMKEISNDHFKNQHSIDHYTQISSNYSTLSKSMNSIPSPNLQTSSQKTCLQRQEEIITPLDCEFVEQEKESLLDSTDNIIEIINNEQNDEKQRKSS